MMLTEIRLRNFRNHVVTAIEFGPGINAFFGNNGQGKTNILEAISYLSLTKSFHALGDADVVQIGKSGFQVDGTMLSDAKIQHNVRVEYERLPSTKKVSVNGALTQRLAALIGRFPVVILSPENAAITFGGPAERRKFMDLTLSQVSSGYLEDLLEYRRILKQRNRMLLDAQVQRTSLAGLIEPWTESLVRFGSRIVHRRAMFVWEFQEHVREAYRDVVTTGEEPDVGYVCGFPLGSGADAAARVVDFTLALEEGSQEEQRRGTTLSGPHRDDLCLKIGGIDVRRFASQGEHKTLQVALKIAEFSYLAKRREETPIFLLDDLVSELDSNRTSRIVAMIGSLGQLMITTTDDTMFGAAVVWGNDHRRFTVEHGTCRPGEVTS